MNRREFISTATASAIAAVIPVSALGAYVSPAPVWSAEAMKNYLSPGLWCLLHDYPDLQATIEVVPELQCWRGLRVVAWRKEFMRHEDDPQALAFAFDYSQHWHFGPRVSTLLKTKQQLDDSILYQAGPSLEWRTAAAREI